MANDLKRRKWALRVLSNFGGTTQHFPGYFERTIISTVAREYADRNPDAIVFFHEADEGGESFPGGDVVVLPRGSDVAQIRALLGATLKYRGSIPDGKAAPEPAPTVRIPRKLDAAAVAHESRKLAERVENMLTTALNARDLAIRMERYKMEENAEVVARNITQIYHMVEEINESVHLLYTLLEDTKR